MLNKFIGQILGDHSFLRHLLFRLNQQNTILKLAPFLRALPAAFFSVSQYSFVLFGVRSTSMIDLLRVLIKILKLQILLQFFIISSMKFYIDLTPC